MHLPSIQKLFNFNKTLVAKLFQEINKNKKWQIEMEKLFNVGYMILVTRDALSQIFIIPSRNVNKVLICVFLLLVFFFACQQYLCNIWLVNA